MFCGTLSDRRNPDFHFRTASGSAGIGQPIIRTIEDLKSPMRVINGNVSAAGSTVPVSGENSRKLLRRNADTVI